MVGVVEVVGRMGWLEWGLGGGNGRVGSGG